MTSKYSATRGYLMGAAAAVLLTSAVGATAGPGHHDRDFGDDMFRMEHMANRLGLDDAQRQAAQKLEDKYRELMRPYVQTMIEGHQQMRKLGRAEVLDEAAVRAQAQAQSAALTEMTILRVHKRHELRMLLTPEQREKFGRKWKHADAAE